MFNDINTYNSEVNNKRVAHAEKIQSHEKHSSHSHHDTKSSSHKKSTKARWRELAGGNPKKSAENRQSSLPVTFRQNWGAQQDTPGQVEQNIQNWSAAHPNTLGPQCQKICAGIETMKASGHLTGDSIRSWVQDNHDPDISKLFNTNIYQSVSSSDLRSFFNAVGLDSSLLPATTKPTAPPSIPGYVTYTFNNLPDRGPDGRETTIQVGGQINGNQEYISSINNSPLTPHGAVAFSTDPMTSIPKSQLPTFVDSDGNTESYVLIPYGMTSGRIYYNGSQNTANTGFSEFSIDANGTPYTNFTAVDGIPTLTSNVQMFGDGLVTNRNGIQTDFATFSNRMRALYNQYDPTGAWAKGMFAADGSIRSGKHMSASETGDPRIENSLSDYLQGTFFTYFADHPLYFTADAPTTGAQSGVIQQRGPNSWVFHVTSSNPPVDLPLPSPTNLNAWISGAFGPNGDDTPEKNIMWGAAKALSSIINKGILPQNTNTSPTNPMNGAAYFDNPANVKNFYQAPFYNVYLRAMHEAGCSAYGADFDDYMGGDGTVSDAPSDHPWVTISFGDTSPPTPPAPPPFSPAEITDRLWSFNGYGTSDFPFDIPSQYTSFVASTVEAYNVYNDDLATFNAITDPIAKTNYWNSTLKPAYDNFVKTHDLFMRQDIAFNLIFEDPRTRSEVTKIAGLPSLLTSDQASKIADTIEDRYVPKIPSLPPAPPSSDPMSLSIGFYKNQLLDWLGHYETGSNQYIRDHFINNIFAQIDSGQITTVPDMENWLNTGDGHTMLQGLLSSDIYNNDPRVTQVELQDLFKRLGLTAPVPTPSGPPVPPTPDLDKLFHDHPDIASLFNNNEVAELTSTLKNEGAKGWTGVNVKNLLAAHQRNYMAMLERDGFFKADAASYTNALIQKESEQAWKNAGLPGTPPPLPIPPES